MEKEQEQGTVDSTQDLCCICQQGEHIDAPGTSTQVKEKLTVVTRGLPTLKTIATNLKNSQLLNLLESGKTIFVHSSCRKRFTERKSVSSEMKKIEILEKVSLSPPKLKLRKSANSSFDWDKKCFICTRSLSALKKVKKSQNLSVVTSYHTKQKIVDVIKPKRDLFSRSLLLRMNSVNDLRSVRAKYHRSCYADIFRENTRRETKIHPQIVNTNDAMDHIIEYIENHPDCQFSLNELKNVVPDNPPALKTIKQRLEEYYGEDIVVSNDQRMSTLLCLKK